LQYVCSSLSPPGEHSTYVKAAGTGANSYVLMPWLQKVSAGPVALDVSRSVADATIS
jgi:hypothetical protein